MSYSQIKRGLIVLAIIFVAGSAIAQSENTSKPTPPPEKSLSDSKKLAAQESNATKNNQRESNDRPSFIYNCAANIPYTECKNNNDKGDENPAIVKYTGRIADFTVALFVATGAIAFFGWRTIRQNEKTEERQLRAYLGIIKVNHSLTNPPNFWLTVKNAGQTPAYNITGTFFIQCWKGGIEVNRLQVPPEQKRRNLDLAATTILPLTEMPTHMVFPSEIGGDGGTLERAWDGLDSLYIGGTLHYRTVFNSTRNFLINLFRKKNPLNDGHWSNYCWLYDSKTKEWLMHPNNNDAS